MKRFLTFTLLAAVTVFFAGCKPAAKPAVATGGTSSPTEAQPRLRTIKLWIGASEMTAEMALTPRQELTGMMFRTNMAENEGMIFVFPRPIRASFWMKNTLLPLSTAYIGADGAIIELHDLKPQDTNEVVAAAENIQFVLEAPLGWFKRNNVNVNTVVSTEHGSLQRVFFGQ